MGPHGAHAPARECDPTAAPRGTPPRTGRASDRDPRTWRGACGRWSGASRGDYPNPRAGCGNPSGAAAAIGPGPHPPPGAPVPGPASARERSSSDLSSLVCLSCLDPRRAWRPSRAAPARKEKCYRVVNAGGYSHTLHDISQDSLIQLHTTPHKRTGLSS
jgi:hypothetical protein